MLSEFVVHPVITTKSWTREILLHMHIKHVYEGKFFIY